MDGFSQNSILGLEILGHRFPFLNGLSVNGLQFITMFWNIFLVGLAFSFYLLLKIYWRPEKLKLKEKLTVFVLFIFWLLFFPNTAYIITDVRHLLDYCPAASPYDVCPAGAWTIIFFFSYSALGWISFYYLLKAMAELLSEKFKKIKPYLFISLIIPLISLGVLLGLLNRFNSWDAIYSPFKLITAAGLYFSEEDYFINWFLFTVFLYWLYFSGEAVFKAIQLKKLNKQ